MSYLSYRDALAGIERLLETGCSADNRARLVMSDPRLYDVPPQRRTMKEPLPGSALSNGIFSLASVPAPLEAAENAFQFSQLPLVVAGRRTPPRERLPHTTGSLDRIAEWANPLKLGPIVGQLIERATAGELASAIKEWRSDYFSAGRLRSDADEHAIALSLLRRGSERSAILRLPFVGKVYTFKHPAPADVTTEPDARALISFVVTTPVILFCGQARRDLARFLPDQQTPFARQIFDNENETADHGGAA